MSQMNNKETVVKKIQAVIRKMATGVKKEMVVTISY